MVAVHSGIIQERGNPVKLIQQVPELDRDYAIETLTHLVAHWVGQGSNPQQTPRVLLRRNTDTTWSFPSGWYTLNDDEVVTLVEHVTEQTGLQPSYAEWRHVEKRTDTAGNLGLTSISSDTPSIKPDQVVIQNVYSKEVLVAPSIRSRTPPKSEPATESLSSDSVERLNFTDEEESNEEDDIESVKEDEEEEPDTLRYVTSVLHSTMSLKQLHDSLIESGSQHAMWVPLERFITALRTGVIFRQRGQQEAVELLDWEPNDHDSDVWFAKATVSSLFQENRDRKILIVEP
jgi:hypothetical protein